MATEPMRMGLSAVPKVATAHSLTGVGVRSMTVEPTASTGEASGETNPATRWPTPAPAAAARTAPPAYHRPAGRRVELDGSGVVVPLVVRPLVMLGVRCRWLVWMGARTQCAPIGERRHRAPHVPYGA